MLFRSSPAEACLMIQEIVIIYRIFVTLTVYYLHTSHFVQGVRP